MVKGQHFQYRVLVMNDANGYDDFIYHSYSRFQQTLHARVPNYIRKLTSGRGISNLHFEARKQFPNFDLKFGNSFRRNEYKISRSSVADTNEKNNFKSLE